MPASLYSQKNEFDYFPKVFLAANMGIVNGFKKDFEKNYNREPLAGLSTGFKLFSIGQDLQIFGVAQYHGFKAILEGKDRIEWKQSYLNIGIRLNFIVPFWARPNAQIYFGGGHGRLKLKLREARYKKERSYVSGRFKLKILDVSIIDHWRSRSYYLEIGQIIPIALNHTPKFSLNWGIKYDHGLIIDQNLSGISFHLGLIFTALY